MRLRVFSCVQWKPLLHRPLLVQLSKKKIYIKNQPESHQEPSSYELGLLNAALHGNHTSRSDLLKLIYSCDNSYLSHANVTAAFDTYSMFSWRWISSMKTTFCCSWLQSKFSTQHWESIIITDINYYTWKRQKTAVMYNEQYLKGKTCRQ